MDELYKRFYELQDEFLNNEMSDIEFDEKKKEYKEVKNKIKESGGVILDGINPDTIIR